jgi:hypothetical protein
MGHLADEKCPGSYSFCLNKNISVLKFITALALADKFCIPMSPEDLEDTRPLKFEAININISPPRQ